MFSHCIVFREKRPMQTQILCIYILDVIFLDDQNDIFHLLFSGHWLAANPGNIQVAII